MLVASNFLQFGTSEGGGGGDLLLDSYPNNVEAGYSVNRKLRAAASDTIVGCKRVVTGALSGQTDYTVTQVNDGTTISAFAAGDDDGKAYFTEVKDQSSNLNHATDDETDKTKLGIAAESSTQLVMGASSIPAGKSPGGAGRCDISSTITLTGAFAISCVTSGINGYPIAGSSSHYIRPVADEITIRINGSNYTYSHSSDTASRHYFITRDSSNNLRVWLNNSEIGSSQTASGDFVFDRLFDAATATDNRFGEVVVWSFDYTSSASGIYTDTSNAYGNDF